MFDSFHNKSDGEMNITGDENIFDNLENSELKKNSFKMFEAILKNVEPNSIIAKDLPRLAKKISIENFKIDETLVTSITSQVLQNLSTFLNSDKCVEPEKFEEFFSSVTPEFQSLFQFLTTYYGEKSKELIILRCITQKSLAHPIIYVKKILGNEGVKFRDENWRIEIKRENEYITVTHLRKEQVDSSFSDLDSFHHKTLYTFNWKIIIFLQEKEETLIVEKCRVEFVSLNDFDSKVATKEDGSVEDLTTLFKNAFETVGGEFIFEKE
jgi:hypothetical protein